MSEDLKYHLFKPTDCIPEQVMFDYIDGRLNPKEQHAVEKHLLDCELCSDALEGLRMVKNRNRIPAINEQVRAHMAAPADTKVVPFRYKTFAAIAAGILLAVVGAFMFQYFIFDKRMNEVAEMKQESNTQELNKMDSMAAPAVSDELRTAEPVATEIQSQGQTEEVILHIDGKVKAAAKGAVAQDNEIAEKPAPVTDPPVAAEAETREGTDGILSYNTDLKVKAPDNISQKSVSMEESNDQDKTLEEVVVVSRSARKNKYAKDDVSSSELKEQQAGAKNAEKDIAANSNSPKKESEKANTEADQVVALSPPVTTNTAYAPAGAISALTDSISPSISATYNWTSQVDKEPEYPGGHSAMLKFLSANINTASYKAEELTGTRIYVEFIIDKKGTVKDAKIKRGVNPQLDKEALRAVSTMPAWIPAVKDGKPVEMKMVIPIRIELK